jgi:hypothetical protein
VNCVTTALTIEHLGTTRRNWCYCLAVCERIVVGQAATFYEMTPTQHHLRLKGHLALADEHASGGVYFMKWVEVTWGQVAKESIVEVRSISNTC